MIRLLLCACFAFLPGAAPAQELTGSLDDVDLARHHRALAEVQDAGLTTLLDALGREHGIFAREGTAMVAEVGGRTVIAVPLEKAADRDAFLVLYYLPGLGEHFFLQVAPGPGGRPEMRLWGRGPSELRVSEAGAALLPSASPGTFRVAPPAGDGFQQRLGVGEAIRCIVQQLGVDLDPDDLFSLLTGAACNATGRIGLVLTAYSCLSIPAPVATIGCINGVTRLITCGLVNCEAAAGSCTGPIALDSSTAGDWTSECTSRHRSGRYAKYYTFTLAARTRVRIDLRSPTADTYLYLLRGNGSQGSVVTSDDDGGEGFNSLIVRTLPAGTYTVEATTYSSRVTGSFTLSVSR